MAEAEDVQGCQRGEGVRRQGVDLVALEAEEGEGGEQGEELGVHLGQLVVGEVEGLEGEIVKDVNKMLKHTLYFSKHTYVQGSVKGLGQVA